MNILFDLSHPGEVHLYKNAISDLAKDNEVVITIRESRIIKDLLKENNLPFYVLGKKKDNLLSKALIQLVHLYQLFKIYRKHKIDLALGGSLPIVYLSKMTKMKSMIFDDDDDDVELSFVKFVHPFCDFLISPDVLKGKRRRKDTIYYPGLHELAYLHPNNFRPDKNVLTEAGISENEKFFILRFNVFKAYHDRGVYGLNISQKLRLVKLLSDYGKVFITTEREIEPELSTYRLPVTPNKIHSLLYYSSMFIGDSQTMTSEAAVLGIPSFRCNTFAGRISYIEEEETKYKLTFGFHPVDFELMFNRIKSVLENQNYMEEWAEKRKSLLSDKIDTSKFIIWLITHYKEIRKTEFNTEFFNSINQ